jgi:hypothetical protein
MGDECYSRVAKSPTRLQHRLDGGPIRWPSGRYFDSAFPLAYRAANEHSEVGKIIEALAYVVDRLMAVRRGHCSSLLREGVVHPESFGVG